MLCTSLQPNIELSKVCCVHYLSQLLSWALSKVHCVHHISQILSVSRYVVYITSANYWVAQGMLCASPQSIINWSRVLMTGVSYGMCITTANYWGKQGLFLYPSCMSGCLWITSTKYWVKQKKVVNLIILQDGEVIDHTWTRIKTNKNYLRINKVEKSDTGVFICRGVNGFGSVNVRVELIVTG